MRKRFPKAEVIALDLALPMLREAKSRAGWWKPFRRVCGDARALPIADQSVDLIFSSLCLQWCEDLEAVFDEFRRVLRPGGWLLCSTFGPDTLTELRQSWAAVDDDPHDNVFIDMLAPVASPASASSRPCSPPTKASAVTMAGIEPATKSSTPRPWRPMPRSRAAAAAPTSPRCRSTA